MSLPFGSMKMMKRSVTYELDGSKLSDKKNSKGKSF
jgi:hypothetical protein